MATATIRPRRQPSTDSDDDAWLPLTPTEQEKYSGSSSSKSRTDGIGGGSANDKDGTKENASWWYIDNLALFGDSKVALVLSGLLLLVALALSALVDGSLSFFERLSPEEIAYRALEPAPSLAPSTIYNRSSSVVQQLSPEELPALLLSEEMRVAFERDGVIAIRGLLDASTLNALDVATMGLVREQQQKNIAKSQERPKVMTGRKPSGKQFYTVRQNAIFLPSPNENVTSPFVVAAMLSAIPKVATSLLLLQMKQQHQSTNITEMTCTNETTPTTVRILRDIFLAKDDDKYICGWHVDDIGFWPALADAPGVNAWIALDDMPLEYGGGFALAVGSHHGSWRHDAYQLTGSTHSFPEGGFTSSKNILHDRPGNGTCNIQDTAPHLHRRMEETKRIYDIKRGDVIFHDRWLFHRTVPFERDAASSLSTQDGEPTVYRRYSVRYGPGSSVIPPGYGTEPSVISLEENGGKTANRIAQDDAAWYPKVFPAVDESELESMKLLAMERLPTATEKSEDRKRLIRPRRTRQH